VLSFIIILNVSYYNISEVLVDIIDGGKAYICVGNCEKGTDYLDWRIIIKWTLEK
jgi:hypothetical protein